MAYLPVQIPSIDAKEFAFLCQLCSKILILNPVCSIKTSEKNIGILWERTTDQVYSIHTSPSPPSPKGYVGVYIINK